jgi:glycosyltransferase involved in cell wall biosynthesis
VKVAMVVQRYGAEVCGGSELLCRQVAEHMARHWEIEVLTSCAVDHFTWKDDYPPGPTRVNGVPVRRFPVDAPRDMPSFQALSARVLSRQAPREEEIEWMQAQGPSSTALLAYVRDHADRYDLFVFFTYLYAFTFFGLPLVSEKAILVPTAHDEPCIYLSIFRELFALPRSLVFLTPQERDFVNALFGTAAVPQEVVGMGVEEPRDVRAERFLEKYGDRLGGGAFVLSAGRIEGAKGSPQLFSHFMRFREDVPERPVKLVLIGSSGMEIPDHPDIIHLGFVSDQDKFDAFAAAELVVLSSPFESLSIVALEAWQRGKPVVANGACEVLRSQCIRSNGGLWYHTYAEFREVLRVLLGDPSLRDRLGASGRDFVTRSYGWETVEAHYRTLADVVRSQARTGDRQAGRA